MFSCRLEQVKLSAVRKEPDLSIFVSKTLLILIQLGTFSLIRKIARHKTMFKVDKNITPTNAQNIFPDKCCTISNNTMNTL